ncbi:MAG TPA: amidohydrolase family protein, partial [Acidimicrobiales bacterium]|nr:amidohydrolase family protein [Acidimicrobiales bacterium]
MQLEDLVLISVDDHVVEPPGMFADRMPARFADQVPFVDRRDDGTEIWRFDGKEATNIGLNAVAGRPVEEYGIEPTSFAEIRPGCFDIHDRVRDMDANGVIASMCFPSFPQLCGQLFAKASDPDLGLAVLRAYNDWHIDEWCGTYPGRLIPLSLPPIWDPEAMADEVRRVADKGCHAVSFSENPAKLKLPSFHSDHWDPFWSA